MCAENEECDGHTPGSFIPRTSGPSGGTDVRVWSQQANEKERKKRRRSISPVDVGDACSLSACAVTAATLWVADPEGAAVVLPLSEPVAPLAVLLATVVVFTPRMYSGAAAAGVTFTVATKSNSAKSTCTAAALPIPSLARQSNRKTTEGKVYSSLCR